ncbi:MAG: tRNA-dihydrouridine synthase [Planctomycetota bacterium]
MLLVGDVPLKTNLLLAPVAGYFDLAYRLVARSVPGVACRAEHCGGPHDVGDGTYGALGLACTELLCPHSVLRETDKAMWRAAISPEDTPVCMQLYGSDAGILAEAARWAEDRGATIIDINMGCPVDKVTKKHGGSKLLCDPGHAVALTKAVVDAVRVPVTAKIRLGWDDSCIVADSLPPRLCDVGVAMITVHGRTTAMKFKPSVRLDGIAQTVEGVKRRHPTIPVIGNGDITTPADAERMIAVTGCDGVMVARGAMGQPWLFRDTAYRLATGEDPPPLPRVDRAKLVLDHFENLCRYRDEPVALRTIKTRISKYSAHLQPWPGLKRDVQPIADAEQFRDFWRRGMERLVDTEGTLAVSPAGAGA